MSSGYYNLYLDECLHIDDTTKEKVYGIVGIIVDRSELTNVRHELGDLKIRIWENELRTAEAKNVVLHAAEIYRSNRKGKVKNINYSIFRSNSKLREVFNGVTDIIEKNNLAIIGCVANLTTLSSRYKMKTDNYIGDSICMNKIINNFACFLKCHNAKGSIIFESRATSTHHGADSKLKKQFYKIMAHGTTIYKPIELQDVIESISFVKKQENEAGLQISDFIIQPFIFNFCGIKQKKPNIYQRIRKQRYSGGKELGGTESGIFGVTYVK